MRRLTLIWTSMPMHASHAQEQGSKIPSNKKPASQVPRAQIQALLFLQSSFSKRLCQWLKRAHVAGADISLAPAFRSTGTKLFFVICTPGGSSLPAC